MNETIVNKYCRFQYTFCGSQELLKVLLNDNDVVNRFIIPLDVVIKITNQYKFLISHERNNRIMIRS